MIRGGVFLVLFAIAIPWYWGWSDAWAQRRVAGVPCWFLVSVVGSFAVSLVAAWQLATPWPGEDAANGSVPDMQSSRAKNEGDRP